MITCTWKQAFCASIVRDFTFKFKSTNGDNDISTNNDNSNKDKYLMLFAIYCGN